jgi:hypothetical protein
VIAQKQSQTSSRQVSLEQTLNVYYRAFAVSKALHEGANTGA